MAEKKTAVTDKTPRKPGRDEPALRPVKAASRRRLAVRPADGAVDNQSLQMAYRSGLEGVARFNRLIAHSLNNVLAISRGNLTLLRCVTKDRDSIEMIDDALTSLNDAESLSSSLASLGNGASFAPVNVEMPKFLLQLTNSLGDLLGAACKVTLDVDKAVLPVHTDPRFLQLALKAVISNAVEAMGGKGVLRINCANLVDASGRRLVRICIRDTGPGFGASQHARAFEAGFSSRKNSSNIGIGLWFARQVALATGGDASLGTDAGRQGAAINIDLPPVHF